MVSDLNIFVWKWSKIAAHFFFLKLILLYKTCLKSRFPMDERPLVGGYIASFWHISRRFWVVEFGMIFSVFFLMGFWLFLVHPTVVLVLLSASVKRCFVSRMRDFFYMHLNNFQLLESVGQVSMRTRKKLKPIQDKLEVLFKKLQWSECLIPNAHQSSYYK